MHQNKVFKAQKNQVQLQLYKCNRCDKVFKLPSLKLQHQNSKEYKNGTILICEVCSYKSCTIAGLDLHICSMEETEKTTNVIKNKQNHTQHKQNETSKIDYRNEFNLTESTTHTSKVTDYNYGDIRYQCDICDKDFGTIIDLSLIHI